MSVNATDSQTNASKQFSKQAQKLSLQREESQSPDSNPHPTTAVEARFITPQDPVIETANGERLPTVPLKEALELNKLRDRVEEQGSSSSTSKPEVGATYHEDTLSDASSLPEGVDEQSSKPGAAFRSAIPPQRTHPLFPDLPMYGPPSITRQIQCIAFRCSSALLSLAFLMVIVLGSAFTSIPMMFRHIGMRLSRKDPDSRRPFYEEEKRRKKLRKEENHAWKENKRKQHASYSAPATNGEAVSSKDEDPYPPLEGGRDPLICDVGYYARRVGLEVEEFSVQTEDGFIINLQHIYDPRTVKPHSPSHREHGAPVAFPKAFDQSTTSSPSSSSSSPIEASATNNFMNRKYPVLLIHGLLQSAGAYCVNDSSSLAFLLCKSGFDVWLGNNRCGFSPRHTLLTPADPRMWNWNIRQMGVLDLSALISRVLAETGFDKLGLVCHSQGTTETFVALAKGQRPDLGKRISVFCALAPAVYAGPLIGKMYFKFMRIISPGMFRFMFGIHSFIPFMMVMHKWLPGRLYGALGYRVFAFLFNWTDTRWDLGLRDRFFQFSPTWVSAESMRWWLGRECFAQQKCILATREENKREDKEDEEDDEESNEGGDAQENAYFGQGAEHSTEQMLPSNPTPNTNKSAAASSTKDRGARAWYDEQVPPFALWVAGNDQLVDGRRLLRRFERGREPHVRVVHKKIIPEYEHLDVLWAMDAPEQVFCEVKECLWKSVGVEERKTCSIPKGCEGHEPYV